jgi:hypothetical protein
MSTDPARVLVVAHRTAAAPPLLDAVRRRASQSPARFTLLVPKTVHGLARVLDPEDVSAEEAEAILDLALPLLEDAAGSEVGGMVGVADPVAAVEDALNLHGFDEVIISTLPTRVSRWLRIDLPHKIMGLGVPVTTVTAHAHRRAPAHV